jgi:CRISPR/Cas system-associated exonuclease Cas4 (RecB family)
VRYKAAAEAVGGSGIDFREQVIFAGFYALTRHEKALFRKLLAGENALFIFQEGPGLRERLKDLGIPPPNPPLAKGGSGDFQVNNDNTLDASPDVYFYSNPDTHAQVFALNRVIEEKKENRGFLTEKTTIVLPASETLFPLLRQTLPVFTEEEYNISLGYPLHRTPIFGFMNNLMELITSMDTERLYIPDYLRFVLHPYTKNISCKGSAEITRIVFHTIEEELAGNRTRTFLTLAEIEENRELLDQIMSRFPDGEKSVSRSDIKKHLQSIHENTIRRFLAFRTIGDFAEHCTALLLYIWKHSTARLHPLFHPFSEAFLRILDSFSRSEMKDLSFRETGSYFSFFRKYVMTGNVPFEGTPLRGLQVLGFLETRNIRFDTIFLLDANEEIIPDTRKDDTLLPFMARKILGLPTYLDRDDLAAYYFTTLLRGAKEVHLFYVENDKRERSRFVEQLLWEKQKKERIAEPNTSVRSVQYRVKLDNPLPLPVRKTADVVRFLKEFRYSATTLDAYLHCQLRFYYSSVLGLSRKETVAGDIERADVGKFVHTALSGYFSGRKRRILKAGDISLVEMHDLINHLFVKEYGKDPSGAAYLLQQQIQNQIRLFLEQYYIPLIGEEQVAVLAVEKEIQVTVESFRLRGRPDMVEKRGGKMYVIDYKTGSNPDRLKIHTDKLDIDNRDSWCGAIGSLQLPVYLMLCSEKGRMRIRDLNGIFLLLGRTGMNRGIELRLFEGGDEEETYLLLRNIIILLLREIVDPDQTFKPAQDRKASCPGCEYKCICGTQWVVK